MTGASTGFVIVDFVRPAGAGEDECQNAAVATSETRAEQLRRLFPWTLLALLLLLTVGGLVLGLEAANGPITVSQLKAQLLDLNDLGSHWTQSGQIIARVTTNDWSVSRCPSVNVTFGGPTVTATYVSSKQKETLTESLEEPTADARKVIHAFGVCPFAPASAPTHVTIARTALFKGIGSDSVGFLDTFHVTGHKQFIGGGLMQDGRELVVVGYVGEGPLSHLRDLATAAIAKVNAS